MPKTGRELWRLSDNLTQVKVPTPIVAGDLVIVTGGYPPGGRPIYAIRSRWVRRARSERARLANRSRRAVHQHAAALRRPALRLHRQRHSERLRSGVRQARLPAARRKSGAGGFSASPVAAAGRIYLSSEDGDIFVVRAGRTFELLSTNPMGEIVMATPAHHRRHVDRPYADATRGLETVVKRCTDRCAGACLFMTRVPGSAGTRSCFGARRSAGRNSADRRP